MCSIQQANTRFDAAAIVPVADGGSVIGAAGLLWDTVEAFGADRIEEITRLVQRVARLVLRNAIGADSDLDYRLNTMLHLQDRRGLLTKVDEAATKFRSNKVPDSLQKLEDYDNKVSSLTAQGKVGEVDAADMVAAQDVAVSCVEVWLSPA